MFAVDITLVLYGYETSNNLNNNLWAAFELETMRLHYVTYLAVQTNIEGLQHQQKWKYWEIIKPQKDEKKVLICAEDKSDPLKSTSEWTRNPSSIKKANRPFLCAPPPPNWRTAPPKAAWFSFELTSTFLFSLGFPRNRICSFCSVFRSRPSPPVWIKRYLKYSVIVGALAFSLSFSPLASSYKLTTTKVLR